MREQSLTFLRFLLPSAEPSGKKFCGAKLWQTFNQIVANVA